MLGAVTFEGQQLRPGVLDPLVPWEPGAEYDQARLLQLQKSLADTDYFSAISVVPEPDKAVDGQVPLKVMLVPAKRSVYNVGLRYGTDSGAGVAARMERRWINDRGHKLVLDMNVAQFDSFLLAQYRVPAFGWLDGWYSYSAGFREEIIDEITTQYVDVIAARSGRWREWELLAGLNFKRERSNTLDSDEYSYVSLVFPSLWGQWKQADDVNAPQHARALTMMVRGGSTSLLSDVGFLQMLVEGRYIRGIGSGNRMLFRGELGATASDDFSRLPPSMRFYAGGDKSIRGFDYQEIGVSEDGEIVRRQVPGGCQRRVRAHVHAGLGRGGVHRRRRCVRRGLRCPLSASARDCAGVRRWARSAWISRTASSNPSRACACTSASGRTCERVAHPALVC